MILVFDLDDTLYPEITYAESGMAAVAAHLHATDGVDEADLRARLVARLHRDRNGVFDDVLTDLGLATPRRIHTCLQVYRRHRPTLRLHPDAERCLERFAATPQYLVTDGHAWVQERKIAALGLRDRMRRCFATHRFGVARAKPSPYCLLRVCTLERVAPGEVVYVGDNPRKDFVGIRPLGFRTIRVRRGMFAHLTLDDAHEADVEIADLDALTPELLAGLRKTQEAA